jgi:hypothetical protein
MFWLTPMLKKDHMKTINYFVCLIILIFSHFTILNAQEFSGEYEASETYPYGHRNPSVSDQIDDFAPMIGICDCKSLRRNPDQTWQDTLDLIWKFKYVLNGTAIQDQTWAEGIYATSIRQIHPDSAVWVVRYNSYPTINLSSKPWIGKKEGENIVLLQEQKAPNGFNGFSRLTFSDISEEGFNWTGEWVSDAKGIVFPFWYIWCKKREIGS